jgi:hypothetical protein
MIDANPLFVDPVDYDYHLSYFSPCRDTGNNSGVAEPYDFENDPRIVYGIVDMGADEFHTHLYYTGEAVSGGSLTVKMTDEPGAFPIILFLGSGKLSAPLITTCGDWLLMPPVFPYFFGAIPADGVFDGLSHTFPSPMYPTKYNLQALIDDQLTNLCIISVF